MLIQFLALANQANGSPEQALPQPTVSLGFAGYAKCTVVLAFSSA
jgi:hypothetical protein